MTRRVRSVFSICVIFSSMIGREARPVTDDRTRPIVQGAYWTVTGRWHCRVRSCFFSVSGHCVVVRCSDLTSASGHSRDQRVRSYAARPVCALSASGHCFAVSRCATSAFGRLDQRVRSVFHVLAVGRPARPVSWTSASGQHDFGCLSF
jgi:hypothetical protein